MISLIHTWLILIPIRNGADKWEKRDGEGGSGGGKEEGECNSRVISTLLEIELISDASVTCYFVIVAFKRLVLAGLH